LPRKTDIDMSKTMFAAEEFNMSEIDSGYAEARVMENKEQLLLELILKENLSAIATLANRLSTEPEEVRKLIQDLLRKGELNGSLTEDGKRFFKSSIRVSSAPVIHRDEEQPAFLTYNTKPGKILATIGFFILACGVVVNSFAADIVQQNIAVVLILIGLLAFLIGLYLIARRETPD
jgi:hypothetical protein